jgi:hypothetical protein
MGCVPECLGMTLRGQMQCIDNQKDVMDSGNVTQSDG